MESNPASSPSTRRLGRWMTHVAWILAVAVLTFLFTGLLDRQHNPNQSPATGSAVDGGLEVQLQRNRYGHYVTDGTINGERVEFLLDTGATDVAIPQKIAARLRLQRGMPLSTYTANGTIITYATLLDRVAVGGIAADKVPATINPRLGSDQVLLGMSFLKRFELLQRGEILTIRGNRSRP